MTTKKHFERAARYIKTMRGDEPGEAEAVYAAMVYLFKGDNERFDENRFRLACGLRVGDPSDRAGKPGPQLLARRFPMGGVK